MPVILAMAMTLGPWDVSFPVEGLNDNNAKEFEARILAYFQKQGDRVLLEISCTGNYATVTMNCQEALSLADLTEALRGSEFSFKPETWVLYGRVGFAWTEKKELSQERRMEIQEALAPFGSSVDLLPLVFHGGVAYHAHIRIGVNARDAKEVMATLYKVGGMKQLTMLWERYPHMPWYDMECGAKGVGEKIPTPKKPSWSPCGLVGWDALLALSLLAVRRRWR